MVLLKLEALFLLSMLFLQAMMAGVLVKSYAAIGDEERVGKGVK